MLPLRPHTILLRKRIGAKAGKVAKTPTYAVGIELACMVQPMSFQAAFSATGAQMQRPHKVFLDCADAAGVAVGDLVEFEGEEYVVSTPPESRRGFGTMFAGLANHATFMMADRDGDA